MKLVYDLNLYNIVDLFFFCLKYFLFHILSFCVEVVFNEEIIHISTIFFFLKICLSIDDVSIKSNKLFCKLIEIF